MAVLHDPATLASAETAAAYAGRLQQQKEQAAKDEQLAAQAAAQASANARLQLLQKQQQQQQQKEQALAKPVVGADPSSGYVGQPVTLKFNAADGSPIDLAQMHGKVVLIDFWATWCGPCMKEVPNVVAAYNKYHGKGFEIVGISLDQDKANMLKVTAEKGMTWPQYFDGKGWNNEISTAFHIRAIPAMWLINKNGVIASTNAHGNIEADIAKLLAE
jgi:thiol-disulfide isomerase/thioredoxin